MPKLGIFSWFSYALPIERRLDLIKQAGFEATSLWFEREDADNQPRLARKLGLEIDNIHAPFESADDLWRENLLGEGYLDVLFDYVECCSRNGVATAVVHLTGVGEAPGITEVGLERIKRLVERAEKRGVGLAFENLAYLEHLDYVLAKINSEQVGFCYDSGHENFAHPGADCLARYGDRLMAIHLNDNGGAADEHLLPGDGTVDWNKLKAKLRAARPLEYMTLEVPFYPSAKNEGIYSALGASEYLALAYERLKAFVAQGDKAVFESRNITKKEGTI